MSTVVLLLAVAGFLAVGVRMVAAVLYVLRHGVDAFLARDLADVRARRGDLTGLEDAGRARAVARRQRLAAVGVFCLWGGLLVIPPLTPWPAMLYASYSLLWIAPRRRKTVRN